MENKRFAGRRALVTGAGAGSGWRQRSASRVRAPLTWRWWSCCPTGSKRSPPRSPRSAPSRSRSPSTCATRDSATAVVETTVAAAGGLDILISNHALMSWEVPFLETATRTGSSEIDVSLTSHYALGRRVAQAMKDAGTGGSIAFTASVDALGAERGCAAYCVAKAGLVALTQVMAVDLAEYGIRVNCVSPGPGDTQRSIDLVGEEMMQQVPRPGSPGCPLMRMASVEDIAEAFLYLASDAASYVTGHNLVVDGGLTTFAYHLPGVARRCG